MLILACDTSNAACSACLYEDGKVLAQSFLSLGLTHSQTFMPMVHELMKLSGRTYQQLDAFACTVGPGSFTGIRIGVSAIKVMAMAAGKGAIPVSSLEALAYPLFTCRDTLIASAIDARNRRVFCSAYYNGQEIIGEEARSTDDFLKLCADWLAEKHLKDQILVCGNAWDSFEAAADKDLLANVRPAATAHDILPSSTAALAYRMAAGPADPEDTLVLADKFPAQALMPVYRARTSAERMFPGAQAAATAKSASDAKSASGIQAAAAAKNLKDGKND